MRPLIDILASALGAQMSLVALVLYEAWPKFVANIFSFDTLQAEQNAQFWSFIVIVGIAVGAVWRWNRRELAIQIGITTSVLLTAFAYLQLWFTLNRAAGLDEMGAAIDDQWFWFWVVLAPAAAGAWWIRSLTNRR